MGSVEALPEDERILIRAAVNRIRDIANGLIEKNREWTAAMKGAGQERINSCDLREVSSVQFLSSLIDLIVSEKRMQFRAIVGIEIQERINASAYGLFAKVGPSEFKRVLSNLIDNAVEAIGDSGLVTVSLVGGGTGNVEIRVVDNGKGIPEEILKGLGEWGNTHDKDGGTGLGLYQARTSTRSWGGELVLSSEVGLGTTVMMSLPQAPVPEWFVSGLRLEPSSTVVIVDDDSAIHSVWQGRFDAAREGDNAVEVVHVSDPEEFKRWFNCNPVVANSSLFLVDFELRGFNETGLDLIESFNISSRSILVTSRFGEDEIHEKCQRLNVRLIPKNMAGFVPITIQ